MTEHYPLWFPYTQMKTMSPPTEVVRTNDTHLFLNDDFVLIDGIASWWTACHGYNHPHLIQALQDQLSNMPHVMLGGLVHQPALQLAQKLTELLPNPLRHVAFSESGSVAVETAIKMVLQYWVNLGEKNKNQFIHFKHAYHGDTLYAMSLCCPTEGMHHAMGSLLPKQLCLTIPHDASSWHAFETALEQHHHQLAGLIIEPLVQGAGGMKFHSPETLNRLVKTTQRYNIPVIFDEIFTGFGRTGSLFALDQIDAVPDVVTIGKGLTGGVTPLAATIASQKIFEAFWSDDSNKTLMHGPTFAGHALGCRVALASIELFSLEPRLKQVKAIENYFKTSLPALKPLKGVKEVRWMGAIGVVQMQRSLTTTEVQFLNRYFVKHGVWLRPFGDIIYLTPAFTITLGELGRLVDAIRGAIEALDLA